MMHHSLSLRLVLIHYLALRIAVLAPEHALVNEITTNEQIVRR